MLLPRGPLFAGPEGVLRPGTCPLLLTGTLILFGKGSIPLSGQTIPSQGAPTPFGLISLYVDCQDIVCDHEYIRTEIPFVTHVRDRRDADVYVLMTAEATAAGGQEANLQFIGQRSFTGLDEELRYVSPPAASEDQVRQGLVRTLGRGLVRYINRTPLADDVTVLYTPTVAATASLDDPWNRWTIALNVNGYVNGEQSVKFNNLSASASASRVTEVLKISTSVHSNYSSNSFQVQQGREVVSHQRTYGLTMLAVGGVSDHASIGVRASAASSSFLNQTLTLRFAPAVEFNLFPFREATRRMLTVEYSAGATSFDYEEETIFGKLSERLFDHRLLLSLRLRQPWGSVGFGAEGSQYLDDTRKHRVIVAGNVDWNLARGLSFVTSMNVARIRDQVFLPTRGASDEEILLRQRQLATSLVAAYRVVEQRGHRSVCPPSGRTHKAIAMTLR